MGRMETPNFDETLPTPTNRPEDGASGASNFNETIPTPISGRPQPRAEDAGKTVRTPVNRAADGAESFVVPVDPAAPQRSRPGGKRSTLPLITLVGLAGLLLIAVTSAFAGYRSGIALRKDAEVAQIGQNVDAQFALGEQDLAEGNYDRARQRFEYVIQLDPNYPGVTEKLASVLLYLNATATPTVAPTPTVVPTPDLRTVEELFSQGQQFLVNSDWTNSIETLLKLRKEDPAYNAVQIDGMLFLALRNRGTDKILKFADLEGGIYDLALAERFGPIDTEAQGIQNWARLYITGASFWEIDWAQAIEYFQQVAPAMPNLRDGSGYTATERYRLALIGYADTLAKQELWCDAQAQYELALTLGPDANAEEALVGVSQNCAGISDEQPPSGEELPPVEETPPVPGEPTPTLEGEPPVGEPTPELPTPEPPTPEPPTPEPPAPESTPEV